VDESEGASLRLVDATSLPKMLLRMSLLQQATPFFLRISSLGSRLDTTCVPHILLNAAIEHPLPSLKQGSKDGKDIPHEKPLYRSRNKTSCTTL
jgi:hypothetical protein